MLSKEDLNRLADLMARYKKLEQEVAEQDTILDYLKNNGKCLDGKVSFVLPILNDNNELMPSVSFDISAEQANELYVKHCNETRQHLNDIECFIRSYFSAEYIDGTETDNRAEDIR